MINDCDFKERNLTAIYMEKIAVENARACETGNLKFGVCNGGSIDKLH